MSDLKISDDLKMQSPADGEYMLKLENLSGKDISIDDISVASDCLNLSDTAFGIELGKDKFYTATFKFVPAMTKNGVCSEYLTITYKVAGDDLAKAIIVPIEITYHPKKWYKSSKKVTRIVGGTLIALSVADKWFKTPSGKKTVRYVANKLAGDDGDDGDDGSGGGFDTRRFAGDLVRAVNDFGEGVVQRIEAFEENAGDEIDNHTAQLKDLQDKVDRLEYERTLAEERNKFKKEMKREIEKFENIPFVAEQPKVVVTVGPLPVIQLVEERHIEITPFVQQQEQSKVVIPVEPLPIIQQVEEQPVVKKKFTDELTQAKSKIKNIYIKTGTVREKENCDGQVIFHLTDGNTIKYKEGEVNVVWVVEAPQVNPPSKWDSMVGDISRVKSDIKNFYTKALNTIEDFAKDPHIFFPAATVVTDFFMNKVSNKKVVKKQGIGRTIYNLLLPFVQGGFPMERSDWN